jgi:hypothetical protein
MIRRIIAKIKPLGNMQKSVIFEGVEIEKSRDIKMRLIPRQALALRMTS